MISYANCLFTHLHNKRIFDLTLDEMALAKNQPKVHASWRVVDRSESMPDISKGAYATMLTFKSTCTYTDIYYFGFNKCESVKGLTCGFNRQIGFTSRY